MKDKKSNQHYYIANELEKLGIKIKFVSYAVFPSDPNMPKVNHSDCTTRALSRFLNKPYEEIFDIQLNLAKQWHCMPNVFQIVSKIIKDNGNYSYHPVRDPYSLPFIVSHMKGRYLLVQDNHVVTFINGTFYDTFEKGTTREKRIRYRSNSILYAPLKGYFQ